jgi:hypothetical protein
MRVEIDGDIVANAIKNDVKAVMVEPGGYDRHLTVTHEGVIVDIVNRKTGRVVATKSFQHSDMLDIYEEQEGS